MLKSHIDAVERSLLVISRIPEHAGHSLHKGTPREAFIKEFLSHHLTERVGIGTGEVIDARSLVNDQRNQIDVVIFKRDYPRLEFGGGINGFLVESVVATIEVKSTLDKDGILQSTKAARAIKLLRPSLIRGFSTGYQPPSVLSFVVAYDGPAKMSTTHRWIADAAKELGISYPTLPLDIRRRQSVASPAIDGVYVLGKGFVQFDNFPIGFVKEAMRSQHRELKWAIGTCGTGSLLLLFILLTAAVSGLSTSSLDPIPYLERFSVPDLEVAN